MATSLIEPKNYQHSTTIMGGNVLLRRIGQVCYMYIVSGNWTNTSTVKIIYTQVDGQNKYFTLPNGYKPADMLDFVISSAAGTNYRMVMRSTGEVESVSVITTTQIRGSITYLTNDAEI